VIPVLVGGARMPTPDLLPDDLKPLAKRQARELRDASWDGDVAALIKRLDEALGTAAPPPAAPAASPRRAWVAGAALLVLIAAAGSAFWWRGGSGGAASSSSAASQSESPASTASVAGVASSPPADPTLAAAIALGLPGTRWRMEDFSGMEPEPGTPKTFEFVVRDGAVLLQPTGKAAQSPMLAKQIHGRAITFLPQRSDGKPFEFMYVFELAADGSKLEHCQTVAVADLAGQGPCQWRYHRASAGAPSTAAVPLPTPVGCGPSMPSEADPACVAAAKAAGLLGEWTGADGKTAYTLAAVGDAVQLRSPALRAEKPWRLLLRKVQEGRVSFAWAGFGNRAGAFDAQMWVEYDLVSVGGAKRLVKCRAITQLSARQEAVDCSDVPAFLAQRAGGG
jgi:hypothetical protein